MPVKAPSTPPPSLVAVLAQLEALGSAQTKKTLLRHGAVEPFFGVKIGDLKPLAKQLKGQQDLALELYATGNSDAQYLAGLIADGATLTKTQLNAWAKTAAWGLISGNTVAWVATEHPDGLACALKWIDAKAVQTARAGWATMAGFAMTKPDADLPIATFHALLDRVARDIHTADGDVAYMMNNFLICVGTYVVPLADAALATAQKIGVVTIDMGDTACKVPDAESTIIKSRRGAPVAAKRKTLRC